MRSRFLGRIFFMPTFAPREFECSVRKQMKTKMMEKRVTCVRNGHGVKVKRCCASCRHKAIARKGARICELLQLKVRQLFVCRQWQMSEGLKNMNVSNN